MSKLTVSQQAVSEHDRGPALVLAGAGSGKTTTALARTANLLENGVPADSILITTFSKRSVEDVQNKATSKFPGKDINIRTLHSIGFEIVKYAAENRMVPGYRKGVDVFRFKKDDPKAFGSGKSLVEDICAKERRDRSPGLNWETADVGVILRAIGMMKRDLVLPGEAATQWLEESGYEHYLEISEVYDLYEATKKAANQIDFDDMLLLAVKALQKHPQLVNKFARFLYIMVDECQDSNRVQVLLVRLLSPADESVMWIGDDFQSIYSFTGAVPDETIYKFRENYPTGAVYLLEENFRCQAEVVKLANGLIEHMDNPFDKHVITTRDAGPKPEYTAFNTGSEEAAHVAKQCIELQPRNGQKRWRNTCVLYRTNRQSRLIEDEMIRNEIPYVIHGGTSFYNRPEVREVLAFVKASYDPNRHNDAVKDIINIASNDFGKTTHFLGRAFIEQMEREARRYGGSFWLACTCSSTLKPYQKNSVRDTAKILNAIAAGETVADRVQIAMDVAYVAELQRKYGLADDEGDSRLASLDEVMNAASPYGEDWKAFFAYVDQVQKQEEAKKDKAFDGVQLMTVHKSKGLEFKNCFVIGLSQGLMPLFFTGNPGELTEDMKNNLKEERRICYVAITRAIDRLFMSSVSVDPKGRECRPSQFLEEMGVLAEDFEPVAGTVVKGSGAFTGPDEIALVEKRHGL